MKIQFRSPSLKNGPDHRLVLKFVLFQMLSFGQCLVAPNNNMGMVRPLGVKPNDPNIIYVGTTPVDMRNKLVQRVTPGGTSYSLYSNPNGRPLFIRRIQDVNRHFVLFPDHNYPPGSGHYIVLRKMMMGIMTGLHQTVYEAYNMYLTNSARAMVLNWPDGGPGAKGQLDDGTGSSRTSMGQQNGGPNSSNRGGGNLNHIDVGEVLSRRKRRPDFQSIQVSFDAVEALDLAAGEEDDVNFKGFSIEAEE